MKKLHCYLCEHDVGEEDYCYGCKQHICDACSLNYNLPFGGHKPEMHTIEEEDT